MTAFDGPMIPIISARCELEARGINKSIEDIRDQMYTGKEHWALPFLAAPAAGAAYMDQFAAPEVHF